MTISAKVICHSVSALGGPALITVKARYPKFIHGELLTHRVFSRNASSSRAIPVERLIQDVMDDPAMPIHWGANQRGMQADKECDALVMVNVDGEYKEVDARSAWLMGRDRAVSLAHTFTKSGYHKQIVNRLLEPFCHITTLISSTNWSNFFALRCHPAAQPEMRVLAETIRDAIAASTPTVLQPGQWHLPFVTDPVERKGEFMKWSGIQLSVARCARVSYETHEGKVPTVEQDLALYDRLVGSEPLHASPCEHQATPSDDLYVGSNRHFGANFGPYWEQYRKQLANEYV